MKRAQTFEHFIVDGVNFAKEYALAVADSEGDLYSSLCIYGRSGSGKTHLLRAIQNYNQSIKNSMYVTCKELMNKLAHICKLNDIQDELNHVFGNIDILLIDNIEFLLNSTLAQKVFTYVYNYMLNSHKQIVVAVKGDVKSLPYPIYEAVCLGVYVETQRPTYMQRIEVLKNEIKHCDEKVNEEVIKYIALNIYTDMRSTLRCMKKIIKICKKMKVSPNIEVCKKYLGYETMAQLRDEIVPEYVIKSAADIFNISVDELMGDDKYKYERSMAIYMCWKLFDLRLHNLEKIFGNRTDKEIVDGILEIEKLYLYSNGDVVSQINAINYQISHKEGVENVDRWDFLKYRIPGWESLREINFLWNTDL